MTTATKHPTPEEKFFFDTNGYLVIEDFLQADHVARLTGCLEKVVARRRRLHERDQSHSGKTDINGANTRIFHILGDDPLLLDLLDYPPLMDYVHGFLDEPSHFHASDAISEVEPEERQPGWHIDGRCNGYRSLRPHIPLLQLKVGYFLSDMSAPDQGNLMLVPGSHKTDFDPAPEQLQGHHTFPGAIQLCVPPGVPASCFTTPCGTPEAPVPGRPADVSCSTMPMSSPGWWPTRSTGSMKRSFTTGSPRHSAGSFTASSSLPPKTAGLRSRL